MASLFVSTVSSITRLACLGFVVVAGMTIPQAWDLLRETTFTKEYNTLYVPIELCSPSSVTFTNDNHTVNFSREGIDEGCRTLQYFINACVASLFFSGAAMLIFVLWDILSKYFAGPIARFSTTAGMELFLTFLLFQTAAVNYALYNECNYWTDYYQDRMDEAAAPLLEIGDPNFYLNYPNDVQTYGDPFFFYLTCIMALTCSGLLLLDALVGFFFRPPTTAKDDGFDVRSTDSTHLKSNTTSAHLPEVDSVADPAPEQSRDPKQWTSI